MNHLTLKGFFSTADSYWVYVFKCIVSFWQATDPIICLMKDYRLYPAAFFCKQYVVCMNCMNDLCYGKVLITQLLLITTIACVCV